MKIEKAVTVSDLRKYLEKSLEYQRDLLDYVRRNREGRERIEAESRRLGRIYLIEDMLTDLDKLERGEYDEDR